MIEIKFQRIYIKKWHNFPRKPQRIEENLDRTVAPSYVGTVEQRSTTSLGAHRLQRAILVNLLAMTMFTFATYVYPTSTHTWIPRSHYGTLESLTPTAQPSKARFQLRPYPSIFSIYISLTLMKLH